MVRFLPFFGWEGSPTQIDDRKRNWVPTYSKLSNLEDLVTVARVSFKRLETWISLRLGAALTERRGGRVSMRRVAGLAVAAFWEAELLGPPVPVCPLLGEASPTKIDYRKKGTLIPSSRLEDLVLFSIRF